LIFYCKLFRARPQKITTKIFYLLVVVFFTYHLWWSRQDGFPYLLANDFTVQNRIQVALDTTVWYSSQEKIFFCKRFVLS